MQLNIPKLSLIIGCISLGVSLTALYFIIANYNINTRADRSLVRTTGAHISRTGDTIYTLQVSFMNVGKEDATGVTLKAGTLNSTTMEPKLLGTENITRLRAALWTASTASFKDIPKDNFREFLAVCIVYGDDHVTFEPDITFFDVRHLNNDLQIESPTASEQEALSSRFSCAKL
jgi:hypothetical protein